MLNARISHWINYLSIKDVYNRRLALARSILATGTLLTLLVNDPLVLFTNGDTLMTQNFSKELYFFQKYNFFTLLPFEYIDYLVYAAIFLLSLVIIGWRPRYTCILHFWICVSYNYMTAILEGGDQISANLALLLIPVFIMDNRRSQWQKIPQKQVSYSRERNLVANYFHLFIKLQMCLLYFHAAVGKIGKSEWSNGTAVYYWFNDPTFGMPFWLHPILDPILANPFGVSFFTWGTIILEVLLFMAILMGREAKSCLLIAGLVFHFSIVVVHGLFSFFFAMAAGLLLYLWIDNDKRVEDHAEETSISPDPYVSASIGTETVPADD